MMLIIEIHHCGFDSINVAATTFEILHKNMDLPKTVIEK